MGTFIKNIQVFCQLLPYVCPSASQLAADCNYKWRIQFHIKYLLFIIKNYWSLQIYYLSAKFKYYYLDNPIGSNKVLASAWIIVRLCGTWKRNWNYLAG